MMVYDLFSRLVLRTYVLPSGVRGRGVVYSYTQSARPVCVHEHVVVDM